MDQSSRGYRSLENLFRYAQLIQNLLYGFFFFSFLRIIATTGAGSAQSELVIFPILVMLEIVPIFVIALYWFLPSASRNIARLLSFLRRSIFLPFLFVFIYLFGLTMLQDTAIARYLNIFGAFGHFVLTLIVLVVILRRPWRRGPKV